MVKAVDLSSLANYTLLTKVAQVRTLQMAADYFLVFFFLFFPPSPTHNHKHIVVVQAPTNCDETMYSLF